MDRITVERHKAFHRIYATTGGRLALYQRMYEMKQEAFWTDGSWETLENLDAPTHIPKGGHSWSCQGVPRIED